MDWERHFRNNPPPVPEAGFGGIMLADELEAVNRYFHSTPALTSEAKRLASEWSRWWIETGSPDNYMFLIPDAVWDEARNRRLAFNLANAVTPAQVAKVEEVAKTGISTEQQRGEPERRDPETGQFFIPPPPVVPTWVKPVVMGALVLVAGVTVLPMIRKAVIGL